MDQAIRNKLRNVVTQCRKLLEDAVTQVLQGQFGVYATGKKDQVHIEEESRMTNLVADEDRACRRDLVDHFEHIQALGYKPTDALAQLVREIAFTHLNRLCAYKMMEARGVVVNGRPFREAVSRGLKSQGFLFYLAEHPEDEKRFNSGHQDVAYRNFLDWLGGTLSEEIGVLFSPSDPANRLYPPQRVFDEVLDLINTGDIKPEENELQEAWATIWRTDETIGWVYQYFTPNELRIEARKQSATPRNSYELAFRNQFFTPRYIVEFLSANTLGRTWYEMRRGNTRLKEYSEFFVSRPDEVFLAATTSQGHPQASQECIDIADVLQHGDESAFPAFVASDDDSIQRMISLAHCVDGYERHPANDEATWRWMNDCRERLGRADSLPDMPTQDILDALFLVCRSDRAGGDGSVYRERWFVDGSNEVRRRALRTRDSGIQQSELSTSPVFVPYREKKDPRHLKLLDPACGSGHFLLYCFDLLQVIYEEAYDDPQLGPILRKEYQERKAFQCAVPALILAHNMHGIDIDLRATQIAALALWLRCQRAFLDLGLKHERPRIERTNIVCAEPMPGEKAMLQEFIADLHPRVLGQLMGVVFDRMKLAGEAGSLLKIEEELRDAIAEARQQWLDGPKEEQLMFFETEKHRPQHQLVFDLSGITNDEFWNEVESRVLAELRTYAAQASNGSRTRRKLFADDTTHGFAFIDLCLERYDVVLMNPPFGDASQPSKPYIEEVYGDTKGDVYKAFVECFQDRLVPGGMLGLISSRTGFFLGQSADWRERIVLRLYRPSLLADLGFGVLDALVETAAYVLRSLDVIEDRQLTLRLLSDLRNVPTDAKGLFSIPKYQRQRGLKRHQAEAEISRLIQAGYLKEVSGSFRRFTLRQEAIESAPQPEAESFPPLVCFRLTGTQAKSDELTLSP